MFKQSPVTIHSTKVRRPVCGVGINDAPYNIYSYDKSGNRYKCHMHTTWQNMLHRCFSDKYKNKHRTYSECTISDDWVYFSSFRDWMKDQDYVGRDLDKDILIPGNKVYSRETCLFVPQDINKILLDTKSVRGEYPVGVNIHKKTGKYMARCNNGAKRVYLGLFSDMNEAHSAYKEFKVSLIKEKAQNYRSEPSLYGALIGMADGL